jgi:hypothetical protein
MAHINLKLATSGGCPIDGVALKCFPRMRHISVMPCSVEYRSYITTQTTTVARSSSDMRVTKIVLDCIPTVCRILSWHFLPRLGPKRS